MTSQIYPKAFHLFNILTTIIDLSNEEEICMIRTNYDFITSDGTSINTFKWEKEHQSPKAIVQIAHGMAEHILRYDHFATFLTENNYIVFGNDHRGHGGNIIAPDDKGYFADENGFHRVTSDMHELTQKIKQDYPNVPIILFGHSMGSFLSRRYIQLYGNEIDGVILSGTGGDQGVVGKIGEIIAKIEKRRIGRRTPSKLMDKLIFGNYNKHYNNPQTSFDFLSRDETEVNKYIEDEYCGFICTSGFFADLLHGINTIHKRKEIEKTPKDLPIYFIAGEADPVGNYGKGVKKTYEYYKSIGCTDVNLTLYNRARHELINEIHKDDVYDDVLTWLEHTVSQHTI